MSDATPDRERQALPPELRPLHDQLLADGAALHQQTPATTRMLRHAAALTSQPHQPPPRPMVRLRIQGGSATMTPEPTTHAATVPNVRPSSRRTTPIITALVLTVVVVGALAGTLYLRHAVAPPAQILYAITQATDITHPSSQLSAYDASTGKVVWHYQANGETVDEITVAHDLVFVYILGPKQFNHPFPGTIVALARDTGKVRWQTPAQQHVDPEITVTDDVVYFGFTTDYKTSALAAVRRETGAALWQSATFGAPITYIHGTDTRHVYISSSGRCEGPFGCPGFPAKLPKGLVAIDRQDGHTVWQSDTSLNSTTGPAFAQVIVADGLLLQSLWVGGNNYALQALHASDGSVAWQIDGSDGAYLYAANATTLIVGDYVAAGPRVAAHALPTGTLRWQGPPVTSALMTGQNGGVSLGDAYDLTATRLVIGQYFLSGISRNLDSHVDGKISALDPLTGAILWQIATGDAPFQLHDDGVTVTALLDDRTVGPGSAVPNTYTLLALDANTGKIRWRATSAEINQTFVQAKFVTTHDKVYLMGTTELLAYAAGSGTRLWHASAPSGQSFADVQLAP